MEAALAVVEAPGGKALEAFALRAGALSQALEKRAASAAEKPAAAVPDVVLNC